ncbi:MAG: transcriptional regulator, PadR-like family [Solirubrobacterales bacterium]|nr:transcriptional regulator, PadR-like family [Solirubrobacterales bacterium]
MPTDPVIAAALPKNFLRPCLLLLLLEQPAHGYDLLERLAPFGFGREDPGRLYRTLRSLEEQGMVHSAWEASNSGPDRRTYTLTRSGMRQLHGGAQELLATRAILDVFLSRLAEFVSLDEPVVVPAVDRS